MTGIATMLVASAALALLSATATARELAIERFETELVVAVEGTLDVTETIRFRFTGAWNGIERDLPVVYRTPQGMGHRLDLRVLSVTGAGGEELRYESSAVRHFRRLRIWIPDAEDAARTIVIRYRCANALRFFDRHDELYWNVTGDEWEMPIGEALATVRLPSGVTRVQATAFTGAYGSRAQDASVAIDGNEVHFEMREGLGFREGLTVVAGWAPGVVRRPGALEKLGGFLGANWALAIPLIAGLGMFGLWRRVGRDPDREPVAVRYEPPPDLTPAEAGTLIDHRMDTRDITATLVDLAVRGFLEIEEYEEEKLLGLIGGGSSHRFHRRRPVSDWSDLATHEREVLEGLFHADGARDTVTLAELKNAFYRHLGPMRTGIYDGLVRRGWYVYRPDRIRAGFMTAGAIVLFLSVHAAVFLAPLLHAPPLTLGLATALTGLVIVLFGWHMPARTAAGARAVESVMGFEEFLSRVEADRFERVPHTPATFERYLPWAMAFGVEDRWARVFRDVLVEPPRWYRTYGGQPFHMNQFGGSLNQLSQRTGAAMASAPRSSGGSGFGGGGSSGGGFGGGGGRGF